MSTQRPQQPTVPEDIQGDQVEARVLRQKIWRRLNVENEHFMGVLVGREGSGKSYTALSIAEFVDPTFHAKRVMFDPQAFLERLQEWKEEGKTQGKMVVIDEAGVGVGVRSWYEKDQIKFNQVLQVIRDENMGVLFTLPRLGELDSMAKGRLHALLEMVDKENDVWGELKWKNMDPDRIDETGKLYKPYPQMRVNGHQRRVTHLRLAPPTDDLASDYEARKDEFQKELYQDAIDEMDETEEEGPDLREIADEIIEEELSEYVSIHNGNKTRYVNHHLIETDYGLSRRKAKTVKQVVEKEADISEVEL